LAVRNLKIDTNAIPESTSKPANKVNEVDGDVDDPLNVLAPGDHPPLAPVIYFFRNATSDNYTTIVLQIRHWRAAERTKQMRTSRSSPNNWLVAILAVGACSLSIQQVDDRARERASERASA
jgi:hypothetical protein